MSTSRPPRLAVALLEWAGADPMLIGDIVEESAHRNSRLWLWRQVLASLGMAAIGRGRAPQPHVRRSVSLTGLPAGIPIGGLGLAVLIGLVTVVSPRSWWILAGAAAAGLVLGMLMILGRRGRQRPPSATIGLHGDARLGRPDGGHADAGALHRP